MHNIIAFELELRELIKKHGIENMSNTSNEALARYVVDCLRAFDTAIKIRTHLYRDAE